MHAAFLPVRLLDGFDVTRDNVTGRIPEIARDAGFTEVAATREFNTLLGTLALYAARAPFQQRQDPPSKKNTGRP
jgi:hypothetical protein